MNRVFASLVLFAACVSGALYQEHIGKNSLLFVVGAIVAFLSVVG